MSGTPKRVIAIGAVSRATGIPMSTLRTWERRYGFPAPIRTEYGHRLYDAALIAHLRMVSQAIREGHRAAQILTMAMGDLERLVGRESVTQTRGNWMEPWTDAVRRTDSVALAQLLMNEWTTVGAAAFLNERVGPFMVWIGEAWIAGEVDIHQEHMATEAVRGLVNQEWRQLAPAEPPSVVCAALPGEVHDLGVYLCAVAVAVGGRRPLILAGGTPIRVIAIAALELNVDAVTISISVASTGPEVGPAIAELRRRLPSRVKLLVGGAGASPHVADTERLHSITSLFDL